jgi:C-terminal processing protease CtpA/Prc
MTRKCYDDENCIKDPMVYNKTAGAILSPSVFDVGGGYHAIIPIAEYFAADGKSIEGKGIEPNVKIKPSKALYWVYRKLKIKK